MYEKNCYRLSMFMLIMGALPPNPQSLSQKAPEQTKRTNKICSFGLLPVIARVALLHCTILLQVVYYMQNICFRHNKKCKVNPYTFYYVIQVTCCLLILFKGYSTFTEYKFFPFGKWIKSIYSFA